MAGGRPSKYKPEYCQKLIEHCSEGLSFESFAGLLKINIDSIHEWSKKHPEFSDAKRIASNISRLWWERQGIDGLWEVTEYDDRGKPLKTKKLNSTVWVFNMKNRFGWRDVTETHQTINIDGIVFDSEYEPNET